MSSTILTSSMYYRSKSRNRHNIRIKKSDAFETIMMEYLLILGMFSRWVELSRIWRLGLLLMLVVLMTKKKFTREVGKFLISIWFITPVALFVLSGLLGDSREYLFFNLNRISWPLIIATSIEVIAITKPNVIYDVLDKNFYFLNLFWIVNIIVLAIQCSGIPLFIRSSWLELNSFYKDQCCGLFGNSGTHELSAFSIFMIMYDLYQGYYRSKGLKKYVLIGFAFLTALITLVLSTQNDNMAFLFILPTFILLFYLQKAQWSGKKIGKKILRMMKYIIPIIILTIIILQIPAISAFVDEKVIGRIERMIHYSLTGVLGSNVRVAALVYSLTDGRGWTVGYGVGAWPFAEGATQELFHGFSNFGLNSMSTFFMLGGIWLYIASVLLFARYLYMASYRTKKTQCYIFVCIGIVVLFTFYTVLFNSLQSMLWLMMTFVIFGFCRDSILNKKQNNR